jgi:O-antigen/teichoic acid export membrane protein
MNFPVDGAHVAAQRDRRIKIAAFTSAGSKGSTFLLQIFAMPFAVRALGPELFGVYAAVLSLFTVVSFADFGIGPGVVRSIAAAHAAGAEAEERRIASTAWFAILGLLCVLVSVVVTTVQVVPVSRLLGPAFQPYEVVFRSALTLGAVLLSVQMLASVFARVQAGYQETHVVNIFGAAGNLVGTVAVLALASAGRVGVGSLILAVLGSATVAVVANALYMLRKRPHLFPAWHVLSVGGVRSFAYDSLGFALITIIAPFLQREGCKLILGRCAGPAALGTLALLLQITSFLLGVMLMFTGPLLPALADAVRRRDFAWARLASRRAIVLALVAGAAGFVVCGIAADRLLYIWVGAGFPLSRLECWLFGYVASAAVWNHVFYILISAVGGVWRAAWVLAAEALLAVVGCVLLAKSYHLTGALVALAVASFLTSAWLLPRIYAQVLAAVAERKEPAI